MTTIEVTAENLSARVIHDEPITPENSKIKRIGSLDFF